MEEKKFLGIYVDDVIIVALGYIGELDTELIDELHDKGYTIKKLTYDEMLEIDNSGDFTTVINTNVQ